MDSSIQKGTDEESAQENGKRWAAERKIGEEAAVLKSNEDCDISD